jgi:hypothetical protein
LSAKFTIEGFKLDAFYPGLNCSDGGRFQKATDSYQYTLGKGKDSLPHLTSTSLEDFRNGRMAPKLHNSCWKVASSLPRRQLYSFETIGQLLIGHQSLLGIVSAETYDRDPQIVSKESDRVEYYPLFAKRTREDGVNLVDDQHVGFKLTR